MAEGLCFPFAVKESRKRGGQVVHALVTHPATGKRFWHAWVERRGLVYDDVNHRLAIRRFYDLFKPTDVRTYSPLEAMVYAVRTRHYGPWERGETGPPPEPPPPARLKAARARSARRPTRRPM